MHLFPPVRLNLLHFPVPPLVCWVSFVRLHPPPIFATPQYTPHACWSLLVTTSPSLISLTVHSHCLSGIISLSFSFSLSFARHLSLDLVSSPLTPHYPLPACVWLHVQAVCALFVILSCWIAAAAVAVAVVLVAVTNGAFTLTTPCAIAVRTAYWVEPPPPRLLLRLPYHSALLSFHLSCSSCTPVVFTLVLVGR